jgi:uncharacterized RDD family membrane protein YckC
VSSTTLDGGARRSLRREVVTPEGIGLQLSLAPASARVAAFMIDMVIIVGVIVAIAVIGGMLDSIGHVRAHGPGVLRLQDRLAILVLVSFFLLRTCYFSWFELRWHGKTPGKRALNIQVIDRRGGNLSADAVIARNLTREVEIFLPVALLLSVPPTEGRWLSLCLLGWLSLFFLLPLFNANRMRIGDFVGGTWVIEIPRAALAPDLAEGQDHYRFTAAQLRVYGIQELQLLEEVLRRDDANSPRALGEVRRRIQRKIGWEPGDASIVDDRLFLKSYYRQLRAELERGALQGRRRLSKRDPYRG